MLASVCDTFILGRKWTASCRDIFRIHNKILCKFYFLQKGNIPWTCPRLHTKNTICTYRSCVQRRERGRSTRVEEKGVRQWLVCVREPCNIVQKRQYESWTARSSRISTAHSKDAICAKTQIIDLIKFYRHRYRLLTFYVFVHWRNLLNYPVIEQYMRCSA